MVSRSNKTARSYHSTRNWCRITIRMVKRKNARRVFEILKRFLDCRNRVKSAERLSLYTPSFLWYAGGNKLDVYFLWQESFLDDVRRGFCCFGFWCRPSPCGYFISI